MTPAGLRSLFRYHRRTTGVKMANPHRFRHTFASDMVRAGVSLPALMQLMGHAQIQTTMVYVRSHSSRGLSAVCESRGAAHQTRTRQRSRETLPLCSAGTSVGAPVPASHRLPHCRPRSRLSPSVSWRRALLSDLSWRRASCRLFAKSTAPRSAHSRLVCRSALAQPALAPAVYIARLLLLRCILEELAWTAQLPDLAHLIRREDIPRAPQRLPRAVDGPAGSVNSAGTAPPQ